MNNELIIGNTAVGNSNYIQTQMSLEDKLRILGDAAKYDVACTSSGVDRRGEKGKLGNSCSAGICHTFAADGRCVSLLKILMSNHCAYDCRYCSSRKSNDVPRATFTPDEICRLTTEFYRRNYIEGLFLSSAILKNPQYTMEKMVETLRLLRTQYGFNGYIHVKAIPGASKEVMYSAGLLADRVSINMELPTVESLAKLAPNKSMEAIMQPMGQISNTISAHRIAIGKSAYMERSRINKHLDNSIFGEISKRIEGARQEKELLLPAERCDAGLKRPFAPAGQSTQMIIGASGETDYDLIRMTQGLYQGFDLKRVFYSAYIPINEDANLPALDTPVPLLREHRLYQADWLLRYYGFNANELLSDNRPYFDEKIDPKCDWALRHLGDFPVEINTATYDQLLRVPGIGPVSVKKIMETRRHCRITFEMLKRMRVVLKRAQYFITCNGRMLFNIPIEEQFIKNQIADVEKKEIAKITVNSEPAAQQMSLFTDFGLKMA